MSTAPRSNSPHCVLTQDLPFFEPSAPSPYPPPPLDVFLRDSPLSPALITDFVLVISHIWRWETQSMGKRPTNITFQRSLSECVETYFNARASGCRTCDVSSSSDWTCIITYTLACLVQQVSTDTVVNSSYPRHLWQTHSWWETHWLALWIWKYFKTVAVFTWHLHNYQGTQSHVDSSKHINAHLAIQSVSTWQVTICH